MFIGDLPVPPPNPSPTTRADFLARLLRNMKKAKVAPSIAAPPTPTPTPTPTSTPELEEEAPVEAAPAEGATPDEDPAKLVVLTAASVRDDVPEPVELGFANVWRWPMMVLVYGSPAKLRTSFPEPQLQPSLQQYESPEAVPLQLKTGFPRFEAVDQKRVSYQSFHALSHEERTDIHTIIAEIWACRGLPGLVRASSTSICSVANVIA